MPILLSKWDLKKKIVFTSHELENFSFPTESFADENGYVQAIVLECTKQSEKGQLFVDEFSVSASPYKKDTWYDATEEYLKVPAVKKTTTGRVKEYAMASVKRCLVIVYSLKNSLKK